MGAVMRKHGVAATAATALLATALAAGLAVSGATAASGQSADPDSESIAVLAPTTFGRPATDATKATAAQLRDQAEQDALVLAYWTPERLASAIPYEPTVTPAELTAAKEKLASRTDTGPANSTPPAPSATGLDDQALPGRTIHATSPDGEFSVATDPVTNFPYTNGKLFFNGYGVGNAYCSASAINTDTKRVIITAGHCVFDNGAWMQNPVFVPRYDNRNADPDPRGIWTVHLMRTFTAWTNDRDFSRDVGFATLNNGGDNNQRIVDTVGGHGFTWNGPHEFGVSIFGYPSNQPDGRYIMWACWGTTFESGGRNSINGCWFGPGASGGPWLDQYDNSTGLGYTRSVTSTWDPSTGQDWGPYFDDAVKTMKDNTNLDW